MSRFLCLLALAIILSGCPRDGGDFRSTGARVAEILRLSAESGGAVAGRFPLHSPATTLHFYAMREFRPAWSAGDSLRLAGHDALRALSSAGENGLPEEEVHLPDLQGMAGTLRSGHLPADSLSERLARFDLLLTDGLLTLRRHLLGGAMHPGTCTPQTELPAPDTAGIASLAEAVRSGRVEEMLRACEPALPAYARLKQALRRAGPSDQGPRDRIIANLERLRWERRTVPQREVRVDCATQVLTLWRNGRPVDTIRVVVGLPDWQTAVFFSAIDRLVVNPRWVSPPDILARELVNYIRADSNYLRTNRMRIQRDSAGTFRDVDPRTVNWSSLQPGDIDFRLLQEPGPGNIMGRVKFLAANDDAIFLHDTPYREDFARQKRLASHGCVRVEDPWLLAKFLLGRDLSGLAQGTTPESLVERSFPVVPPVPLSVVYLTFRIDPGGRVRFLDDLYSLDAPLSRALRGAGRR